MSRELSKVTRRKKIVLLANRIVDIELTKYFCCLNKCLVFPTNLFVEPTKEFLIVFCMTKLFVRRTKILFGQQRMFVLATTVIESKFFLFRTNK